MVAAAVVPMRRSQMYLSRAEPPSTIPWGQAEPQSRSRQPVRRVEITAVVHGFESTEEARLQALSLKVY